MTAHDGFTLARPRVLQREAQRGQRRGQPRRRVAQPLVELRRRRRRPTTRRSSPCAPGSSATSSPRCCCRRACRCCSAATSSAAPRTATTTPTARTTSISWFDWEDVDDEFQAWCRAGHAPAPPPPRLPAPALVPGPPDPRRRGPRLVPVRRRRDERGRLGDGLREERRRLPQRRIDHDHRRLRWPDRRRQLLRDVQRQRHRAAVDAAQCRPWAATGSSSSTPTSSTSPAPRSRAAARSTGATRSMVVLRTPDPAA